MRSPDPRQPWAELYRRRLDWASAAYERFLDGIHPDVRQFFARNRQETSVVLYGPTQVGKTTLLLQLVGVSQHRLAEAALVLRGGQPAGRPATAVATRYQASIDDCWSWHPSEGTVERLEQEALAERLAEVRASVECGDWPLSRPLEIGIPRSYLASATDESLMNVLDLPGISPLNPSEQRYVQALAADYLPGADLVVLVGRADDLGFLNPAVLGLPELANWAFFPERFRIVLTYAFEAKKMQERLVQADGQMTLEHLRAYLLDQIQEHDLDVQGQKARLRQLIYPMDYGGSWARLEAENPRAFRLAATIQGSVFEDLRRDLVGAATEDARIGFASRMYEVVEQLREQRLQGYAAELDALQLRHDRHTGLAQTNQRRLDRLDADIDGQRRQLQTLDLNPHVDTKLLDAVLAGGGSRVWKRDDAVQRTRALGAALLEAAVGTWEEWLRSNDLEHLPATAGDRRGVEAALRSVVDHAFEPAYGYCSLLYRPTQRLLLTMVTVVTPQACHRVASKCAATALIGLRTRLELLARECSEAGRVYTRGQLAGLERKRRRAEHVRSLEDERARAAAEQAEVVRRDRDRYEATMQHTVSRAREFRRVMANAFDERRRGSLQQLGTITDPDAVTVEALGLLLAYKSHDRLWGTR